MVYNYVYKTALDHMFTEKNIEGSNKLLVKVGSRKDVVWLFDMKSSKNTFGLI